MRVHVGPLPSRGVTEWIAFARAVLAERTTGDRNPSAQLAPEVVEGFAGFLAEWEAVARSSETFLWETEVDPEQIEFLALALFKIAVSLDAGPPADASAGRPAASDPFYQAFVTAFLDAMSAESKSRAAYAEELRSSWPGLDA